MPPELTRSQLGESVLHWCSGKGGRRFNWVSGFNGLASACIPQAPFPWFKTLDYVLHPHTRFLSVYSSSPSQKEFSRMFIVNNSFLILIVLYNWNREIAHIYLKRITCYCFFVNIFFFKFCWKVIWCSNYNHISVSTGLQVYFLCGCTYTR